MVYVLYVYAEGNDIEPSVQEAVATRLARLVEEHRWAFFHCRVVNQRRGEDGELGVNLSFEPVEASALPRAWFSDVEAVLDCVSELARAHDLSFVVGLAREDEPGEDIFDAASPREEVKRQLKNVVTKEPLPTGWLRRTVRFDVEGGSYVAAIGDYRVAFGVHHRVVFELANGERTVQDVVREVTARRIPGLRSDPTLDVVQTIESLSRDAS